MRPIERQAQRCPGQDNYKSKGRHRRSSGAPDLGWIGGEDANGTGDTSAARFPVFTAGVLARRPAAVGHGQAIKLYRVSKRIVCVWATACNGQATAKHPTRWHWFLKFNHRKQVWTWEVTPVASPTAWTFCVDHGRGGRGRTCCPLPILLAPIKCPSRSIQPAASFCLVYP